MLRTPIFIPRKLEPSVENPYGYIYITTNLVNNKKYVGKHQKSKFDNSYCGSGKIVKLAIKKYGKKNFVTEPIDWAETNEELNQKEKYWIKFIETQESCIGYNISSGGDGLTSEEVSGEKNPMYGVHLVPWNKGKKGLQESPFKGKHHTEKTKNLLSEKKKQYHKAHPYSEKQKQHQSLLMSGKNNPMYGRIGEKAPTYGKHWKVSQESILKRSETVKANGTFAGKNNPRAKKIVQLSLDGNLIKIWDTQAEARDYYEIDRSSMTMCLQHKRKSCKGFIWMYESEYYELGLNE